MKVVDLETAPLVQHDFGGNVIRTKHIGDDVFGDFRPCRNTQCSEITRVLVAYPSHMSSVVVRSKRIDDVTSPRAWQRRAAQRASARHERSN